MAKLETEDRALYHRGYGDGIDDAHTSAWRTGFVWGVVAGFWIVTLAHLMIG